MEVNKQELKATIRTVPMDRAIPNGFDLIDYLKLMSEYETGGDYADICIRIGDFARTHAENALKDGHLSVFYWLRQDWRGMVYRIYWRPGLCPITRQQWEYPRRTLLRESGLCRLIL